MQLLPPRGGDDEEGDLKTRKLKLLPPRAAPAAAPTVAAPKTKAPAPVKVPTAPAADEGPDWLESTFLNPWHRGMEQAEQIGETVQERTGLMRTSQFGENYLKRKKELEAIPMTPEDQAIYEKMANYPHDLGGGFSSLVDALANPRIALQVMTQSLPAMGAQLAVPFVTGAAGSAVGGPVGGTIGAVGGMGAGSMAVNYPQKFIEFLEQDPRFVSGQLPIEALLNDPAAVKSASDKALLYAVPVAIADAASLGLAGKLAGPIIGRVGEGLFGKILGGTAELGMQAGLGSGGDIAGQLASTGTVNPAHAMWEGLLEFGMAGPEAAIHHMFGGSEDTKPPPGKEPPPIPDPGADPNQPTPHGAVTVQLSNGQTATSATGPVPPQAPPPGAPVVPGVPPAGPAAPATNLLPPRDGRVEPSFGPNMGGSLPPQPMFSGAPMGGQLPVEPAMSPLVSALPTMQSAAAAPGGDAAPVVAQPPPAPPPPPMAPVEPVAATPAVSGAAPPAIPASADRTYSVRDALAAQTEDETWTVRILYGKDGQPEALDIDTNDGRGSIEPIWPINRGKSHEEIILSQLGTEYTTVSPYSAAPAAAPSEPVVAQPVPTPAAAKKPPKVKPTQVAAISTPTMPAPVAAPPEPVAAPPAAEPPPAATVTPAAPAAAPVAQPEEDPELVLPGKNAPFQPPKSKLLPPRTEPTPVGERAAPETEASNFRLGHALREARALPVVQSGAGKKALKEAENWLSTTKLEEVETPEQYRIGDKVKFSPFGASHIIIGVRKRSDGKIALDTINTADGKRHSTNAAQAQGHQATALDSPTPAGKAAFEGKAEPNKKGIKPGDRVVTKFGKKGEVAGVWKSKVTLNGKSKSVLNVAFIPDGAKAGTYSTASLDNVELEGAAPAAAPAAPAAAPAAKKPGKSKIIHPEARFAGVDPKKLDDAALTAHVEEMDHALEALMTHIDTTQMNPKQEAAANERYNALSEQIEAAEAEMEARGLETKHARYLAANPVKAEAEPAAAAPSAPRAEAPRKPPEEIFPKPAKTVDAAKTAGPTIPQAQADTVKDGWKADAKAAGDTQDNSNKVIISLFDASGSWSQPWRDAGYTVLQYDARLGDDIFEDFPIADIMQMQDEGKEIVGVLAATPCTTFAASGARWWQGRHDMTDKELVAEMFGPEAAEAFATPLEANQALVAATEAVINLANPSGFHVMENPIGRLPEMTGLPEPTMRFDPNHYGDPYTKRTQLWGTFSTDLPTAHVEPTEGSKMQSKVRGNTPEGKVERSLTPKGFAYSFFTAQHAALTAKEAPPARTEVRTEIEGPRRKGTMAAPTPVAEPAMAKAAPPKAQAEPKPKGKGQGYGRTKDVFATSPEEMQEVGNEHQEPDATAGTAPDVVIDPKEPAVARVAQRIEGKFMRAATNRGVSYADDVWTDNGHDPDEARQWTAERQLHELTKIVKQKFGFKGVDVVMTGRNRANPHHAIQQLKNAYRNLRFMAAVLEIPANMIGLNGELSLVIDKANNRYLGAYDPKSGTIYMSGRSNSFAHEWMHAVDSWLVSQLTPASVRKFLSKQTRFDGLDPHDTVQGRFINLIRSMYSEDTAQEVVDALGLELQAAAVNPKTGNPTIAAKKAQAELDRVYAGKSLKGSTWSTYFLNAVKQDNSRGGKPYYSTVHEMIARSFEAYIGWRMAGQDQQFVAKGDDAYLAMDDMRLAETFPKSTDRDRIFSAMGDLWDALRNAGVTGTGTAEPAPTSDLTDPNRWLKALVQPDDPSLFADMAQEIRGYLSAMGRFAAAPISTSRAALDAYATALGAKGLDVGNALRLAQLSWASFTKAAVTQGNISVKRGSKKATKFKNPGAFYKDALGRVAYTSGEAGHQPFTHDERLARRIKRYIANLEAALKHHGVNHVIGLDKADQQAIWRNMIDHPNKPNMNNKQKGIGGAVRETIDNALEDLLQSGRKLGYVIKGYAPRITDTVKIAKDTIGFIKDATVAYGMAFDQDIRRGSHTDIMDAVEATALRMVPENKGSYLRQERQDYADARKRWQDARSDPKTTPAQMQQAEDNFRIAGRDLLNALKPDWTRIAAEDWAYSINGGTGLSDFSGIGPGTNITKKRTLPHGVEVPLEKWLVTNPVELANTYAKQVAKLLAQDETTGNPNGNTHLDVVIARNADEIRARRDPAHFDKHTVEGRLNIIRELADPVQDNLVGLSLEQANKDGGLPLDTENIANIVERLTGRDRAGVAKSSAGKFTQGTMYHSTNISLLGRSAFSAFNEPTHLMMITGDLKAMGSTLATYMGRFVPYAGTNITRRGRVLAQMLDLTVSPFMEHMIEMQSEDTPGNRISANYFNSNLQERLTRAQRESATAGMWTWMRGMAAKSHSRRGTNQPQTPKQKLQDLAYQRELEGMGIPNGQHREFTDWLMSLPDIPSTTDLQSDMGQLFANALTRKVHEVIQNPNRGTKPMAASTVVGQLGYQLMSVAVTLYEIVVKGTVRRVMTRFSDAKAVGYGNAGAAMQAGKVAISRALIGGTMVYAAQMLQSMVRELLFNHDQWDKHEKDDDLWPWLAKLAWDRSGFLGLAGNVITALDGIRYERDITSLATGAGVSSFAGFIKALYQANFNNSPNNNTAERELWKSVYLNMIAPVLTIGVGGIPSGGLAGDLAKATAVGAISSRDWASGFATMMAGPSDTRYGK